MATTDTPQHHPHAFSFCALFSRPWMFDRWIAAMKKQTLDWSLCWPIIMLDHFDRNMADELKAKLKEELFPHFDFCFTGQAPLSERGSIQQRRIRILENWQQLMLAGARIAPVLLGSEDDSLPEHPHYFEDLVKRLLEPYQGQRVGFVQGAIVGRWDLRLVPHYRILETDDGPIAIESGVPTKGWVPIDGGGWYGFAMGSKLVDAINWEALERPSRLTTGPDVDFVRQIVAMGAAALGSWDLWVEHVTQQGSLKVTDGYGIIHYKLRYENEKWRANSRRYPPLEEARVEAKPMALIIDNSPDLVWCEALRTFDEMGKLIVRGTKFKMDRERAKRLVALNNRIKILDLPADHEPGEPAPPTEPVAPAPVVRNPRQRRPAPNFGVAEPQPEVAPSFSAEGLELAEVSPAEPIPAEEYHPEPEKSAEEMKSPAKAPRATPAKLASTQAKPAKTATQRRAPSKPVARTKKAK